VITRTPPLYSIPLHCAFADALAAGLIADAGADPMRLARTLVLLPNRRAASAVTEAFVRQLGNGGLLLPRLVPVGDLDALERLPAAAATLSLVVPPLLRRFELARLVQALPADPPRAAVESLRLGDALGAVLDALLAEEVPPEALRAAVADRELASHWERSLAFLELIIAAWPEARRGLGGTEGATRLAALIDATIAGWQDAPPARVVAAGLATASPPIVRLLRAVLALPDGMVVLPGLDLDLSAHGTARWEAVRVAEAGEGPDSAEHPQWQMKRLLHRLGLERGDCRPWPHTAPAAPDGPPERTAALLAALAPAATLHPADPPGLGAFAELHAVECATAAEEAQLIALALREALETPGRRAALVTPDRQLARRVAAHCRRWGLVVDDSAGTPLALTPPGALAQALVAARAGDFAPVALLAVLKHPLVNPGAERLPWLDQVRRADRALRGVRPPPGLDGAGEAITRFFDDKAERAEPHAKPRLAAEAAAVHGWWAGVDAALQPLAGLGAITTLPALAGALRTVLGTLAGDAAWAGAEGRQLARLLDDVESHGASFGRFAMDEAPALLAALLAGQDVRVPHGGHPRLAILGPVEAQLARADLMILGGLNEGTWPGQPAPDPWLAPAIRRHLGLPGMAEGIGLAAQDFARAAAAPHVLLTRARRDAGGPQVASRLWLRLAALAGALPARPDLIAHARALDGGGAPRPRPRPAPNPPLAARPQQLSITDADTLLADPFAFHARKILGLRAWDALDEDPTPQLRGEIIHAVLEDWIKAGHGTMDQLHQLAETRLAAEAGHFPLLRALWLPRARAAIDWAGAQIMARLGDWPAMHAEVHGNLTLSNGITLSGRVDRVDRSADGRLAVIDYKTGAPPAARDVQAMDANQLALGLAMAAAGKLSSRGGAAVPGGEAAEIAYWQLKGSAKEPGKITRPLKGDDDVPGHVKAVLDTVTELTTRFLQRETPMEAIWRPAFRWNDYDHLARVAEWANQPKSRTGGQP